MKKLLILITFCSFSAFAQELEKPTVSHQSGFYTDEFQLTISHTDPTVTILYTLDGSEPKIENLVGKEWNYKKQYPTNPSDPFGDLLQDTIWTYEYTNTILVKDRSVEQDRYADISTSYYINQSYLEQVESVTIEPNKKMTILRVRAFKDSVYSDEKVYYYFIYPNSLNPYTLPIILLNIDPEQWYSYENGMNVPGKTFDDFRQIEPNTEINPWFPANFRVEGSSSEIEVHFTYIENSIEKLNHNVGLRLQGSGSRYLPNRSLRLYAKSSYGPSSFNHTFFKNYNYGNFKRLILRNSGQDASRTMFQDAFIHQLIKKLNVETQEYQPTILFINGEYHGIYNIRERFDDKYFERVYNIDVQDLDYIEYNKEVKEGDDEHYKYTVQYAVNNNLSDSSAYEEFVRLVDKDNCTDYFISQIFINNQDWPTNNNEFWRKRVPYTANAPYGHDGRWRWLTKDLDDSFGISWPNGGVEVNDLRRVTKISGDSVLDESTLFLRKLLENENYTKYFINRFLDLLNTTFKPAHIKGFIADSKSLIENEIDDFIYRWNPMGLEHNYFTVPNRMKWDNYTNRLIKFSDFRGIYAREHLKERFQLTNLHTIILDVNNNDMGYVTINTIDIDEETDGINGNVYPWVGQYFSDIPVKLTATPLSGYKFSHWSGVNSDSISTITIQLDDDTYLKANFKLDIEEKENSEEDTLSVANSSLQAVQIYPNPAKDYLSVLSDTPNLTYAIFSIDGREILNGVLDGITIDIQSIETGRYILRLEKDGHYNFKHFIKQ